MGENHIRIIKAEIKKELKNLERLRKNCVEFYERHKKEVDSSANLRVLGSFLHDFYTCIERIFRKIANDIDGELPNGPSWHSTLLERMTLNLKPIRKSVINDDLMNILYDYLRFRHIFRHLYGFELEWKKMSHLINSIQDTYEKVNTQLKKFISFLEKIDKD